MAVKIANFSATLQNAVSASSTTIVLNTVADFPTLTSNDHANLSLEDTNGNIEVVRVNSINTSNRTLTVVRGVEGNSRAYPTGTLAELRNDPVTLRELITDIAQAQAVQLDPQDIANIEAVIQRDFNANLDARVTALVEAFALQGNSARIPYGHLENVENLDAVGITDINDSDDLLIADRSDSNTIKRTSFGQLTAKITENIPSGGGGNGGGSSETGETIKTKLEALTGEDRLDSSAVKNLPSGGALSEVHEMKYPITAASSQSITVAQAGGRAFNDIRTFTGTTPNTDTHTSRQTNGIRIDETGFYQC